jgi:hypothetical protein
MKTSPATPRKSRVFTRHDLYRHRSPLDEGRGIHLIKAAAARSAAAIAALEKFFLSVRASRRRNQLETAYSLRPSDHDTFDIGGRQRTGHQHHVFRKWR